MSFKNKSRKKSPVDNRVTLQAKHNQKCDYFNKKKGRFRGQEIKSSGIK